MGKENSNMRERETSSQFHQYFTSSYFPTKVYCAVFLQLQVVFVIFWWKKINKKAACKMLVKLTQWGRMYIHDISGSISHHFFRNRFAFIINSFFCKNVCISFLKSECHWFGSRKSDNNNRIITLTDRCIKK